MQLTHYLQYNAFSLLTSHNVSNTIMPSIGKLKSPLTPQSTWLSFLLLTISKAKLRQINHTAIMIYNILFLLLGFLVMLLQSPAIRGFV